MSETRTSTYVMLIKHPSLPKIILLTEGLFHDLRPLYPPDRRCGMEVEREHNSGVMSGVVWREGRVIRADLQVPVQADESGFPAVCHPTVYYLRPDQVLIQQTSNIQNILSRRKAPQKWRPQIQELSERNTLTYRGVDCCA